LDEFDGTEFDIWVWGASGSSEHGISSSLMT